jgi:hypothetical protein
MPAFRTDIERNVNLQLGAKSIGPFSSPDDITAFRIEFSRDQWTNPEAQLAVAIQISYDNGPFVELAGFTAQGGPPPPPPRPNIVAVMVQIPPGANRRIQGTYIVTGSRFRTTITIEGRTE